MSINGHAAVSVEGCALIHPYACVQPDCQIGARTKVWQFASVVRGARIGEDCSIASCSIVDGSRLGDRVIVGHGAFIGPGMVIGNDVFFGPYVKMCNDYWPRVTKNGWFETDDLVSGKTIVAIVCNGASIGAGATVMPGVVVGDNAMVAAGAVVTNSIPANVLYKRDGVMSLIDPLRLPSRMRTVSTRM